MPLAMSSATPSRPIGCRASVAWRALSVSLVPLLAGAHGEGLLAHVGLDEAGMDRVDPDLVALAAELQRRRLGEQRHAALGQRIERVELRADEARDRGEIDDGGTMRALRSALLEMRQRRARAQHDAGQVHRDQPVPLVERGFLHALADEDAGIVHQHVELAELLHRGVHRGSPARLAGDVERDIERLAARRLDLLRRLPAALVEHVADRHLGAGARPSAWPSRRRCRAPRPTGTQPCRQACSSFLPIFRPVPTLPLCCAARRAKENREGHQACAKVG